jgi:hypothetical protein
MEALTCPKSCTRVIPNPKNSVSKLSNKLSVLKTLVFEKLSYSVLIPKQMPEKSNFGKDQAIES